MQKFSLMKSRVALLGAKLFGAKCKQPSCSADTNSANALDTIEIITEIRQYLPLEAQHLADIIEQRVTTTWTEVDEAVHRLRTAERGLMRVRGLRR